MTPRPALFTIPPHRAFADALVAGLIDRYAADPMALARGMILLPNNRAVRAIRDAFVRRAEAGLLMPRLVALGDAALDERLGASLDPLDEDEAVPPAVAPLERQMILARLVQDARAAAGDPVDAGEAVRLAAELARTLDQLHAEGIAPERLRGAVADAEPVLAQHWEASLAGLEVILSRWPIELAALGRIDPAERRERLLMRAAARWAAAPPAGFVVAAGVGAATPTPGTARLLRTIAGLREGMVVLAGLDRAMPDEQWDALGPHAPDADGRAAPSIETHPQFHLKLLLGRMGVNRREVAIWRRGGGRDAPAARSRAIGVALAPASFTGEWSTLKPPAQRLTGVRAVEFAGPAEEAQGIAAAIRQALETPARTVALVTPDRALARRVVAHLERWGVAADDSAGTALSATPPGALLSALAEAAAERFAPVATMALLKHPLVRSGDARAAWLEGARTLDAALRGPRPGAGLAGIGAHLAAEPRRREAASWWGEVVPLLAPLEAAAGGPVAPLLAVLREAADALGGDAVWDGPAGRAAASLFDGLAAAAPAGPTVSRVEALPALVRTLLDGVAVRPPQGGHHRVFVWGLIEARLQQTDLTILGGLNEGVWPTAPQPDPWLAPAIRRALGLPGLERGIGLAAHDFAMGLGGPQVLVTRARRDARAPAVASRLWLRLEAMTGGMTRAPEVARWARAIDPAPARAAYAVRPAPAPPVADRPKRIAVTRLDRLKADPFAFYAQTMLRLAPWDALDADPAAAWRGSAVHAAFEAWMKEDACDPAKLAPRAAAMLATLGAHPVLKALWTPRLADAMAWVAERIAQDAAAGRRPLVAEQVGETEVAGVTLHGKVDRIDVLPGGGLAIVDYKTGQPPSKRAVAEGYAMQLGLLGLIAERGGFAGVAGLPEAFEYWSLARGKGGSLGHVAAIEPGRDGVGPAPAELTALAARQIAAAAGEWLTGDAPFTALLHPEYAPYGEYDQLSRRDEWYGREG